MVIIIKVAPSTKLLNQSDRQIRISMIMIIIITKVTVK